MAEPTREQLLALMHANERTLCESKDAPAAQCAAIFEFYRKQWKENHPDSSPPKEANPTEKSDTDKAVESLEEKRAQSPEEQSAIISEERTRDRNHWVQLGDPERDRQRREGELLRKREKLLAREESLQREREMEEVYRRPRASLWPGVDEAHGRRMQAAFEGKGESSKPELPRPWHKHRDLVVGILLACGAAIMTIALLLLPVDNKVRAALLIFLFLLIAFSVALILHYFDHLRLGVALAIVVSAIVTGSFGWYVWPDKPMIPDIYMRIVNPQTISVAVFNDSGTVAKEVRYSVIIWDIDSGSTDPLPIYRGAKDWMRTGDYILPLPVFDSKAVPQGHRLVGMANASCPTCRLSRSYWLCATSGQAGWYGEAPQGQLPNMMFVSSNLIPLRQHFDEVCNMLPVIKRLPISGFDPTQ